MMELISWGTPEQVVAKWRAFGEAGLRHVVPIVLSPLVSQEAAGFTMQSLAEMAGALRSGQ
jgi:phthiodiolone/phenolphthiodiolone dimycocerosates ketoreductase